jgi:hypothetical protein
MIKKTLTYDNFDGGQETKDFYFHLSKGDLISMMLESGYEKDANFVAYLQKIVADKDAKIMIAKFKELIGLAYGVRTEGGGFRKSEELREDFLSSPAFDELFYQVCTDANFSAEFVNGLIPKSMLGDPQINKAQAELEARMANAANVSLPTTPSVIAVRPEGSVNDIPAAFQKREDGHNLLGGELDPAKKLEDYTQQELQAMPSHHFQELVARSRA